MARYTLTSGDDDHTGTRTKDVFKGYGGGTDILKGLGGDDEFRIQYGQEGTIKGGGGTDSIVMTGHNNHTLSEDLKIVSVEKILLSESNFYASAEQISQFSEITPLYSGGNFYINIMSGEALVDLSTSYTASPKLSISAYDSVSSTNILGSNKGDVVDGSSFSDALNGGKGRDILTGWEGNDDFVFSTKLRASNVDHITDFTSGSDRIVLDDRIFKGVTNGNLADVFHDLSTGGESRQDRILYDKDTGVLSYDADGSGGRFGAIDFAILDTNGGPPITLTALDFAVF